MNLILLFSIILSVFAFGQNKIVFEPKEQISIQYKGYKKYDNRVSINHMDSLLSYSKSIVVLKCQNLDTFFLIQIKPSFETLNSFYLKEFDKNIDSMVNTIFLNLRTNSISTINEKKVFQINPNHNQYFLNFNSYIFEINTYLFSGENLIDYKNNSNDLNECPIIENITRKENLLYVDLKTSFLKDIYSIWQFDKILE